MPASEIGGELGGRRDDFDSSCVGRRRRVRGLAINRYSRRRGVGHECFADWEYDSSGGRISPDGRTAQRAWARSENAGYDRVDEGRVGINVLQFDICAGRLGFALE